MPRVKRAKIHLKKRRKLYAKTKGYKWRRKNTVKQAKEAVVKAGVHSYVDRRKKKRTARGLWQIRIGAMVKNYGLSYSKFMGALKKNNIILDRKILSGLAVNDKKVFEKIIEKVKA
ncbi:MAG: 50S ribosomal protein L20 [Patescibacteria group bacterium]|jgi:large subunit ribosomal protein L20